ncbi:hypothetical protein L207DRAFT_512459 [Hyaloscypha variabilis F]|uniref:Transcription factor domain-containing protein n=1 Tax=Hyaloscypha variabilis (strain UAMH 11265 / GT02V1 / F) TaxID=1149755 RepID=A0A2J6RLI4_HYAVF|nr:hypothetical protein L207DRAFT_512459 [Hyaloscypha variabilis F]
MHLVIANAALHLKALRPSPSREDNLVALAHVEAAMMSVNQRIPDSRQNATDEILGAILGLMCHALNSLRFDHYARHVEGFQTILDLCGGLRSIESATNIRLSLFWIEFNTCAAQDAIPRFLPPFHLIKNPYSAIHESLGRDHFEKAMQVGGISSFLTAEMLDVFSELSLLTMALRAETPQRIRWDDDNFPGFGFYPTLHKLLTMQVNPAEDDLKHGVQEMCRLGALFFLAEVRRKFGIAPVITGVQSEKLHRLFEYNGRLWDEELAHMRIWTFVMAACAADTPVDRLWAVKSLIGSESSIPGAWDKPIGVVANMWWIDEVFLAKSEGLQAEFMALSST